MLRLACSIAFFSFAAFFSACAPATSHLARLRAEDGRVIEAGLTEAEPGRGTFWVQLPDGEFLTGEFFTGSDHDGPGDILATPWGPITTVSMPQAVSEILRFEAAGNRGTSLRCVSFPRGGRGVGGCRDSAGHSYELRH
jgi:hypothetical protein